MTATTYTVHAAKPAPLPFLPPIFLPPIHMDSADPAVNDRLVRFVLANAWSSGAMAHAHVGHVDDNEDADGAVPYQIATAAFEAAMVTGDPVTVWLDSAEAYRTEHGRWPEVLGADACGIPVWLADADDPEIERIEAAHLDREVQAMAGDDPDEEFRRLLADLTGTDDGEV